MIASVPLIVAGYPMINVDLDQYEEYEEGIRRVSRCVVGGGDISRYSVSIRSRRAEETMHR